jgi:hypothetical protein
VYDKTKCLSQAPSGANSRAKKDEGEMTSANSGPGVFSSASPASAMPLNRRLLLEERRGSLAPLVTRTAALGSVPSMLPYCRCVLARTGLAQAVTGASRAQKNALLFDPSVGLCVGSYAGPRGWVVSYDRGTPVQVVLV